MGKPYKGVSEFHNLITANVCMGTTVIIMVYSIQMGVEVIPLKESQTFQNTELSKHNKGLKVGLRMIQNFHRKMEDFIAKSHERRRERALASAGIGCLGRVLRSSGNFFTYKRYSLIVGSAIEK